MERVWTLLSQLSQALSQFCPLQLLPSLAEDLHVNGRTYRVLKQLGEGGYATVYLARELVPGAQPVAVKKIIAASEERLAHAAHEVEVLRGLAHPNCLRLLDSAVVSAGGAGGRAAEVLLVTPAYQDGTLMDELDRLAVCAQRLSSRQVLHVFRQVCAGVGHMHARGLAHMDLKPHNVLIARRQQQQQRPAAGALAAPLPCAACADDDHDVEAGRGLLDSSGGGGGGSGSGSSGCGYEAIVMDVGSARAVPLRVASRSQALTVQEDAEAHSTATYRAPELFDVPSHCTITASVDVWALGCMLYAMMYGASPFQHALDRGASLALAVINCHVPWPSAPGALRYPPELEALVTSCLAAEPERRPGVPALLQRIDRLLDEPLPAPAPRG